MVGNIPNFTREDVLRVFLRLNKRVSRAELVKGLDLGEGTVRGILNILKDKSLIISTVQGHSLNRQGRALYNRINNLIEIKRVISDRLYPKHKKIGMIVKNPKGISIDYILRDTAIKQGADGALILRFEKDRLVLPQLKTKRFSELGDLFDYKNRDMLIITFAEDYKKAENGALAIAMQIFQELKERFI